MPKGKTCEEEGVNNKVAPSKMHLEHVCKFFKGKSKLLGWRWNPKVWVVIADGNLNLAHQRAVRHILKKKMRNQMSGTQWRYIYVFYKRVYNNPFEILKKIGTICQKKQRVHLKCINLMHFHGIPQPSMLSQSSHILTDEEVASLCRQQEIKVTNLPSIYANDPLAIKLGAEVGNVIITREYTVHGFEFYHRLCCEEIQKEMFEGTESMTNVKVLNTRENRVSKSLVGGKPPTPPK